MFSHLVMSISLWLHGLYSPWNSLGQNTGVGSILLLQGIFPPQGSNPGLPHCRWILYQVSHKGSPRILEWVAYPFSSRSSWPRNRTRVSCIAGRFLNLQHDKGTFLVAQMVKRLPTVRETQVQSLGREDLEKEMATHSGIFAWKIPWTEEPGRLQSMGSQRVRHYWATSLFMFNCIPCLPPETSYTQTVHGIYKLLPTVFLKRNCNNVYIWLTKISFP